MADASLNLGLALPLCIMCHKADEISACTCGIRDREAARPTQSGRARLGANLIGARPELIPGGRLYALILAL